jgi:uncharacterized membrane protein YgaE (UPF0421/DUF939 family)
VTAVFAYLVALPLPLLGAAQPALAPLTALLVVQVSLYQTLRSAVHRVVAVGSALHLGDAVLEVPVSAMLTLSNATRAAAVGRIVETAIGTAAGLAAGFVFTRPRLQPAEEAIEDLCRKLSDLLTAMADGLATGPRRGELISQLDRLGHELGEGKPERSPRRRRRSWRRLRPARLRPPRRLLSR